jgi:hypothetical protein
MEHFSTTDTFRMGAQSVIGNFSAGLVRGTHDGADC